MGTFWNIWRLFLWRDDSVHVSVLYRNCKRSRLKRPAEPLIWCSVFHSLTHIPPSSVHSRVRSYDVNEEERPSSWSVMMMIAQVDMSRTCWVLCKLQPHVPKSSPLLNDGYLLTFQSRQSSSAVQQADLYKKLYIVTLQCLRGGKLAIGTTWKNR